MAEEGLNPGTDGKLRCWWSTGTEDYQHYHDHEWGFPVADDQRLFEKICLEGFQAGLSWITILRKRENFRRAFAHFDFDIGQLPTCLVKWAMPGSCPLRLKWAGATTV